MNTTANSPLVLVCKDLYNQKKFIIKPFKCAQAAARFVHNKECDGAAMAIYAVYSYSGITGNEIDKFVEAIVEGKLPDYDSNDYLDEEVVEFLKETLLPKKTR